VPSPQGTHSDRSAPVLCIGKPRAERRSRTHGRPGPGAGALPAARPPGWVLKYRAISHLAAHFDRYLAERGAGRLQASFGPWRPSGPSVRVAADGRNTPMRRSVCGHRARAGAVLARCSVWSSPARTDADRRIGTPSSARASSRARGSCWASTGTSGMIIEWRAEERALKAMNLAADRRLSTATNRLEWRWAS
jgi:hypothetical protein